MTRDESTEKTIANIRQALRDLGYPDIDDFTDAEIAAAARQFGKQTGEAGLSVAEAADSLRRFCASGVSAEELARVFRQAQPKQGREDE